MNPTRSFHQQPPQIFERIAQLRQRLLNIAPSQLAHQTGALFVTQQAGQGRFEFIFLNNQITLPIPEWQAYESQTGQELGVTALALILYYFSTADGTAESTHWISFSELPDGRFYNQAFQGYTGLELSRIYQKDFCAFEKAATAAGGVLPPPEVRPISDHMFWFQVLPRISLFLVGWQGDEDFPPSFQVLFNANIHHFLPTDVCAVLGSMLIRKVIGAGSRK